MIDYDNRDQLFLLLARAGSVVFSPSVLVRSLFSTVLCALILASPQWRTHLVLSGSVVRIFASILGYVIVFRTNIAFNRFFEGAVHAKSMYTQWKSCMISVFTFIDVSRQEHMDQGNVVAVETLSLAKARLIHWFSMLTALAALLMTGSEEELVNESIAVDLENRVRNSLPTDDHKLYSTVLTYLRNSTQVHLCSRTTRLGEDAELCGSSALVFGKITEEEAELLRGAHDQVLTVARWILLEMSFLHASSNMLVDAPIMSRTFQEFSGGMEKFFMGMHIVQFPFPFPFAQFLQCALWAFILLCPFAVMPSWTPDSGLATTWPALLVNFFCCSGFVALNEIAIELEEPFGDDANDYPVLQDQWGVVRSAEDCYFSVVPRDFCIRGLGSKAESCCSVKLPVATGSEQAEAADDAEAGGPGASPSRQVSGKSCATEEADGCSHQGEHNDDDQDASILELREGMAALQTFMEQSIAAFNDLRQSKHEMLSRTGSLLEEWRSAAGSEASGSSPDSLERWLSEASSEHGKIRNRSQKELNDAVINLRNSALGMIPSVSMNPSATKRSQASEEGAMNQYVSEISIMHEALQSLFMSDESFFNMGVKTPGCVTPDEQWAALRELHRQHSKCSDHLCQLLFAMRRSNRFVGPSRLSFNTSEAPVESEHSDACHVADVS